MNNYSLTLLIKEDIDEKERTQLLSLIKGKVENEGGKVNKEDLWGSRSLSYPIKHLPKAFYVHFEFEANPKNISSLDKMVKLNEDVIRYLLIRV